MKHSKKASGTLFATNPETKTYKTMSTQVKQQNGAFSATNWKAFLGTLEAEVAEKITEVISKHRQVFEAASDENKLAVVKKLARIFTFSLDDYKISTERVFLMITPSRYVTVSIHYLVYLRIANSQGVDFVGFVATEDGEKLVLEKDGKQKEYFLRYNEYKERSGVWKTHFTIMFRKTLAKQALMFLFPDVFESSILADVATYDEDDLVPAQNDAPATPSPIQNEAKPSVHLDRKDAQEMRKKNTKLYAKINQNKAVFSQNKELLQEFETFMKLRNYKSVVDITDEEDLKFAHALSEALRAEAEGKASFHEALVLRENVLIRLQSSQKKNEMRADVLRLLAESGYETISEVGNIDALQKLLQIVEKYEQTQA